MKKDLIIKGRDIIKKAIQDDDWNQSLVYNAMPWQMINLDEKTKEWKKLVADYFEWIGLQQIEQKAKRYIKNRRLAVGLLDLEDYNVGNSENPYTYMNHELLEEDIQDPLKRSYPIIPPFIKVLHGEFLKRDLKVFVSCVDRETENEKLQIKLDRVKDIVLQDALEKKKAALQKLGITQSSEEGQESDQAKQKNEEFQRQMELEKKLVDEQLRYKKYRHIMEEFGQLILNKDRERFHMDELETEAFIETICNEEEAWVLLMGENDYKPVFLDNSMTFYHQSKDVKYFSEGDYFGWFEEATVGDIINKLGRKLKKEDIEKLEASIRDFKEENLQVHIIPDAFKSQQGIYGANRNRAMEQWKENELINTIAGVGTNTMLTADQLAASFDRNRLTYNFPKLYRIMYLFFRSQRKIGWLTKKDRSGVVSFQGWIDENFKVTEKPVYNYQLTKEDTVDNLIYGEHIDWEWANEWRYTEKISANYSHPFWRNGSFGEFEPIYIDGDPVKFNFKGSSDNPFEVSPPFEGVNFHMKGVRSVSQIELLAPYQILANIAMNKVPDIMFDDVGLALAINKLTIPTNNPGVESTGDPLEAAMETLRKTKTYVYNADREILKETGGNLPITPQVLNLSRIQEGIGYLNLTDKLKEMAGEAIGVSRQMLAQSKASESATQTNAGINYSEVQLEYLYNRHISDFMPRVYTKMIEAALYYCSKSKEARVFYQTSSEGNAFLEVENLEGLFKKYHIVCKSNIKEKELKAKLDQLFLSNTNQMQGYEIAQGLVDDDPSTIINKLREAQVKREELEQRKFEQEQKSKKEAMEYEDKIRKEEFENNLQLQQLKNESAERIAAIRNNETDLLKYDNSKRYNEVQSRLTQLKNQNTAESNKQRLELDKLKHNDQMELERQKLQAKDFAERQKLIAGIVNQNQYDDKELNRQVAKKQGITE